MTLKPTLTYETHYLYPLQHPPTNYQHNKRIFVSQMDDSTNCLLTRKIQLMLRLLEL
jgi:hypothetical protein